MEVVGEVVVVVLMKLGVVVDELVVVALPVTLVVVVGVVGEPAAVARFVALI